VNRKADFFYKTNGFESIRLKRIGESIRIANRNALPYSTRVTHAEAHTRLHKDYSKYSLLQDLLVTVTCVIVASSNLYHLIFSLCWTS